LCANELDCQSDVWRFCKNDSDLSFDSLIVTRAEPFRKKTWKKPLDEKSHL